jgi:hypothetical protein
VELRGSLCGVDYRGYGATRSVCTVRESVKDSKVLVESVTWTKVDKRPVQVPSL